jgi:hypothetical protein
MATARRYAYIHMLFGDEMIKPFTTKERSQKKRAEVVKHQCFH